MPEAVGGAVSLKRTALWTMEFSFWERLPDLRASAGAPHGEQSSVLRDQAEIARTWHQGHLGRGL